MSRKVPRGLLWESYLTTASCFTFSLCFQTTQMSKKNTTFPTCSRSPRRWHMSVCTACRAAQCLHCAAALLVLQPELQCWHDAGKCSIIWGWSCKSHYLDVSAPVAGSVQPARKGHDSNGHTFSSSFSWGYWARMYPWEGPCTIWQESLNGKFESLGLLVSISRLHQSFETVIQLCLWLLFELLFLTFVRW